MLPDEESPKPITPFTLREFQEILHTEISGEFQHMNSKRKLSESDKTSRMNMIWDHMLEHGWHMAEYIAEFEGITPGRELNDKTAEKDTENQLLPFIVCSRTPLLKSGAQRLPPLIQFTGARENDTVIISNDDKQTCAYVATTFEKAKFLDTAVSNDEYTIVPLTDLMKTSPSTFEQVRSKEWSIPSPEDRFRSILYGNDYDLDWERVLRVTLVSGRAAQMTSSTLVQRGQEILNNIQVLGSEGSLARRRLSLNSTTFTEGKRLTLSDAFSLTSSSFSSSKTTRNRALSSSRMNSFSRSLELGLEASHACASMFENILIRPVDDNVLDIVLNPEMNVTMLHRFQDASVESTSSNTHCVSSLVIGLSVNPQVLSIEVDLPVSPDDYQSQWITQSNSPGRRPLFDVGLTGKGQIVSVTDSGLDYNHRFFGPTSNDIHHVSCFDIFLTFTIMDSSLTSCLSYETEMGHVRAKDCKVRT